MFDQRDDWKLRVDAGRKMDGRGGVLHGDDIRIAHPAHAHRGVLDMCRTGRLARRQDDGRTVQAVRGPSYTDHGMEAPIP